MRQGGTSRSGTRSVEVLDHHEAAYEFAGEDRDMQRLALREMSRACLERGPYVPEIATALAHSLARLIGGGCIIRGRFDHPTSVPLACAHARAASFEGLRQIFEASPHALAFACSAQATQTGQAILLPHVSSQVLQLWTQPAAWSYLEQHQVGSLLVAPVRSTGRVGATIVVWREHVCRPLTHAHAALLQEVGQRIALALRQI